MYLRQKIMISLLLLLCSCGDIQKKTEHNQGETIEELTEKARKKTLPKEERIKYSLQADSLAILFNTDSIRVLTLAAVAEVFAEGGDKMVAKQYYLQAAELAKHIGKMEKAGVALNNIGIIYNELSMYDSAREYYTRSIEIFVATKHDLRLAQAYINMGIVDKNAGNYEGAFVTTQKAVQLLGALNAPKELTAAYTNCGNILKNLGRYDEALRYHQLSLEIKIKTKDSANIAGSLNNIGNIYRYKKQYYTALDNYLVSLKIKESLGQTKTIATTINNIAEVYTEVKDYKNAETYFNKAVTLCRQYGDEEGYIATANRLSKLYMLQGKLSKAEVLALEIKEKLTKTGFLKHRLENALILADLYKRLKQNEKATEYAYLAMQLKDSLFSDKMAETVSRQNANFNLHEKDKENNILKRDMAAGETKLTMQKNYTIIWTAISIIVLVISLLAFHFWRKRKNNKFEQELLLVKQEALNAQMSDHFISSAMDSIDKFMQNNNTDKASEYLLLFHRLIRKVLEHSLKNLISVNDELNVVNAYITLEQLRFPAGKMQFETKIDAGIDCEYTQIPPMIFQVLIENAIIHGLSKETGGKIILTINRDRDTIACSIEDNGIGRNASRQLKAGIANNRVSFGSSLVEKSIKTVGGSKQKMFYRIVDITDDAGSAAGTRIEFSLPYLSLT